MSLTQAIHDACGQSIQKMKRISGGDICEAYCAILDHGSKVFVKIHDNAQMLYAESLGLEWLSSAGAETPSVLAVSPPNSPKGYLVLSWVDSRHPLLNDWVGFGEQLASVHSTKDDSCGWIQDNYLGELHQSNRRAANWIDFFRDRRLMPQMKQAIDTKRASVNLSKKLDPLLQRLNQRLIQPRIVSRLHGDLWHGNIMFQKNAGVVFIDPSPYAGHREMDFAMMELFGGFHPRAFAAYEDLFPLQPEWRDRILIYQLYYLLAHVNLHGASWMGQVYSTLDQIG